MSKRHHISALVAAAAFGVATMVGATACAPGTAPSAVDVAADLGPEGQALAALGLDPDDLRPELARARAAADPHPAASASPGERAKKQPGDRQHKRRLARVMLRRNVLHGEVVVQTKEGPRTVVVQRGEVTEITDTTVTLKSTDGFTLTWTFGNPIRVLERRQTVAPDDVGVGTWIGVAGAKEGETTVARLIVVTHPD
jgi:hypothetical protein